MNEVKEFHLIVTDGGVGDLICELVAVHYNITHHPRTHFHVWVPDYLLEFAQHVLPPKSTIRPFSKAKSKFRHDIPGYTTEWCTNHTAMRTHPVDYGFHMLSDRHIYRLEDKNYLQIDPSRVDISRFGLPENYVCIAATYAEQVKALPAATFLAIVELVVAKGYTPVYLGKEEDDTGFQQLKMRAQVQPVLNVDGAGVVGISLVNRTSLLEGAAVIAGARAFVGLDGGLVHLAGCTDTSILAGYTLVDPIHVAPIRKGSQSYRFYAIEPDEDVKHRYYQTYDSGFMKGDYRKFPGWEDVVANMTAAKFCAILEDLL